MSYALKSKYASGQNYALLEATAPNGNGDSFTIAELNIITNAIGMDLSDGVEVTLKITGTDNKVTINDAGVKTATKLAILAYGS